MARYAKGKKSYAISDRGGQRVRYTQLKTTWDGLRVAPDEWEPKHPQLTPAKNIIDAEQLFKPRSTGQDREDVVIYLAHTFDPFTPSVERKSVGCPGHGKSGLIDRIDFESYPEITGVAGTAETGTETVELSITETGVAGTGAVPTAAVGAYLQYSITVSNPGAGNRYYVDSVLQQQLYLQEGQTYRLDQSDSSNSGHPIRFSTTSNGSHGGGSEYTTGVTTNGTPGSSGAYTQITVASGAPTLYYYCTNHSNMGGTSYTPASGTISLAITVANPGVGNRYYIDTGGPAITISLTEGTTYRFDQSDSSNSGHPLRFSTTSNGSHGGGSEYTTGVTTNGTPGSSGAYTEITVASSAPTLYYYCTSHSGMGGQLNTPAITGAVSGGVGLELTESVTGLGGTGGVGNETLIANPIATGLGGTGGVGNETIQLPSWGDGTWGSGTWGN